MKRIRKLILQTEILRTLSAGTLGQVGGGATNTNTGTNTLAVCVDTDLNTNCLCGGYTIGCTVVTYGCDATTRVIC